MTETEIRKQTYLKNHSILLVRINQLEILDGSHRDTSIEIEDICANLLIPARRLIDKISLQKIDVEKTQD